MNMRRLAVASSVALVVMFLCGVNTSAAIDLSTSSHSFDIAAGAKDITVISFDFNYGTSASRTPAFRIRKLNDDGTDDWIGVFNIDSGSFNVDTDYGPYSAVNSGLLSGTKHYEFSLNRSNGLWGLAIGGTNVDFYPTTSTNSPQPDGIGVTIGSVINNKYFSDESLNSGQNAIGLGWASLVGGSLEGNAADGVGGTGAYRFVFLAGAGASVDNFTSANVPEPATFVLLGVLGVTVAGYGLWRRYGRSIST
jgi:hypothetical protein